LPSLRRPYPLIFILSEAQRSRSILRFAEARTQAGNLHRNNTSQTATFKIMK
jgi:hypothetical protein